MDTTEMMMNIAVSLLLTVFIYLLIPALLVLLKRKFSLRAIKVIVVLNGVIGWILFNVLRAAIGEELSTNVWPAFLWSSVAYWLMKKACLKGVIDEKEESENAFTDMKEKKSIEDDDMGQKDALKTIVDIQAQETIKAMEANGRNQYGDEERADFGLVPENPIYTHALKMVEGETEYLRKLRTLSGEKITWNRRGSTSADGVNGMIDIYDIYLSSGELYKTIFINMYGAKESTKLPVGFSVMTEEPATYVDVKKTNKVKIKYCSRCGSLIDNTTKICTGCGKKYFKGIRLNKTSAIILVLSIALGISVIANIAQFVDRTEIDERRWYWMDQAETLREEKADLQSELWAYEGMVDFVDRCVVFVEDDGTDWYHKYECNRFKANSFWAFNIEAAKQRGYTACPYCH